MSRRLRPWSFTPVALASLLAIGLHSPDATAQSPAQRDFALGSDVLKWLLKKEGFEPVREINWLDRDPEHSCLIVLGQPPVWMEFGPASVRNFVAAGGALLAASDLKSGKCLPYIAGVRVTDDRIECRADLKRCLQEQPDCPFVIADDDELAPGETNPFSGLRVATNRPSRLVLLSGAKAKTIARFPENANLASSPKEHLGLLSPRRFAIAGRLEKGSYLVLADHSVFINEMLLSPDCDNLDFTVQCLKWLQADGQRTKAMLVVDGRMVPNFDATLRPLPKPPLAEVLAEAFRRRDQLADEAQRRIGRTEHDDGANAVLDRALGGPDYSPRTRRYAWWGLGAFLAAMTLYRLGHSGRYGLERGLPNLARALASQRPASAASEGRQLAQVEAGNLWDSARALARQHLSPDGNHPGPPLLTGGGWWRRRAARSRLRRLEAIAYGSRPVRIRPRAWERFLADLDGYDRDVSDGVVRWPPREGRAS